MSSIINAGTSGINITGSSSTVLSLATNGTTRVNIDASGNISAATGNLTFSSTSQRITGDMTNATIANRLSFQTNVANNFTAITAIPNGTGGQSQLNLETDSAVTNGVSFQFIASTVLNETRIQSGIRGTGTYLPMTFYTNGAEKARLTVSGNLLVGTTTDVSGLSGVISDVAGNVRNIPSAGSTKVTAYTLAVTDIGEFVTVGASGSITVPNNTFATGNAISVYNDTTGNVSINISTTTAYVVGTNTNRTGVTLATRGIANILFINPSYCILSGNLT